jgi:hypothetical protein
MHDLERLVGRYGVLGLATLTTIAAVGTFVSWAAAHGLLGPTARVILGLVLAAALAATGLRLRGREPSFGSALIMLALAVVHVCAWAAGPGLLLVADPVAFSLAAGASAALAAFAYVEREEPLWCVGIAGAALAPFIATGHSGSTLMLASYGAAVGVAAAVGLSSRAWRYAEGTLAGVAVLYGAALLLPPLLDAMSEPDVRHSGPLLAVAVPFVILLVGVLPSTPRDLRQRRVRAQALIASSAAALAAWVASPLDPRWTSLLLAAEGLAWLTIADRMAAYVPAPAPTGSEETQWVDGALIPLLFAAAAAIVQTHPRWWPAGVLAGATIAAAAAAARRPYGASREALAFTAALVGFGAGAAAPFTSAVWHPVADAMLALVFAAALVWRPSHSWAVASLVLLAAAAVHAWVLLAERGPYLYPPFATRQSGAALVALGGAAALALNRQRLAAAVRGAAADGHEGTRVLASTLERWWAAAPWVWAFVWAHRELAAGWSRAVSTFALVSLEASTAVLLVGVGRARDTGLIRQTGLALALVAALRALTAAEAIVTVGLRIASYLVVSIFLLGIAYWYRRRPRAVAVPGGSGGAGGDGGGGGGGPDGV